jgi:polyisoprenoid-binding protein YceI
MAQVESTKEAHTAMATTTPTTGITWNLDPAHSSAEFKVKHMMISHVKGIFSGLKGSLTENLKDPALSRVEVTVDIATINTGDAQRDAHLKSADFFHHEQHPTMTFKSTKVEKRGDDSFSVTGNLKIREVSKQVILDVDGPTAPAKDPWGNTRIGLSATTKINRKDFCLIWNTALETGGFLVGEEVQITIEAQFVKA